MRKYAEQSHQDTHSKDGGRSVHYTIRMNQRWVITISNRSAVLAWLLGKAKPEQESLCQKPKGLTQQTLTWEFFRLKIYNKENSDEMETGSCLAGVTNGDGKGLTWMQTPNRLNCQMTQISCNTHDPQYVTKNDLENARAGLRCS